MVDSQHCISVVNPLPNLDPSPAWLNHLRCGKSTTYIETSGKSCEKVRKITKPIRENVGKASPFSHLLPTFSHLSGPRPSRSPAVGVPPTESSTFCVLSALGPRKHSGCLLLRPIPVSTFASRRLGGELPPPFTPHSQLSTITPAPSLTTPPLHFPH